MFFPLCTVVVAQTVGAKDQKSDMHRAAPPSPENQGHPFSEVHHRDLQQEGLQAQAARYRMRLDWRSLCVHLTIVSSALDRHLLSNCHTGPSILSEARITALKVGGCCADSCAFALSRPVCGAWSWKKPWTYSYPSSSSSSSPPLHCLASGALWPIQSLGVPRPRLRPRFEQCLFFRCSGQRAYFSFQGSCLFLPFSAQCH